MSTGKRSPWGAAVAGGGATVACQLPLFLTGALAVELADDLVFGTTGLGLAVGSHRAASVATTIPLGRFADRLGAVWSLRLAVMVSSCAAVGIGLLTPSWNALIVWLAIAGCGQALAGPAANRLLVGAVGSNRLATAFGIKQSAPPLATMLAGLSVPVVAPVLGWRWAYLMSAMLGLSIIVLVGRRRSSVKERRPVGGSGQELEDRSTIAVAALAFGIAVACSAIIPAFYVSAAVDAGDSQEFAGLLLGVASALTVVTRILSGIVADRMAAGQLRLHAAGLAVGGLGLTMLVLDLQALRSLGVVVALVGTWGFSGVYWFSMMRAYRTTPGKITGVLALGGLLGGLSGPLAFGLVADTLGYVSGWSMAAIIALTASLLMFYCSRRLRDKALG